MNNKGNNEKPILCVEDKQTHRGITFLKYVLLLGPYLWPDVDQVVGQCFEQVFGRIFDQGVWTRKYSVQFYQDKINQNKHY